MWPLDVHYGILLGSSVRQLFFDPLYYHSAQLYLNEPTFRVAQVVSAVGYNSMGVVRPSPVPEGTGAGQSWTGQHLHATCLGRHSPTEPMCCVRDRGAVTGTQPNNQVHAPTRRALGLSSHAVRPEIPIGCFFGHDLSLRRLVREEGRSITSAMLKKNVMIGSRKRAKKPTGRDSQLNLHFGRQNKEHTLLALKEGPVFRVRSMPQRLQCKRVWKGKVEKNHYTFSYPLGKEPPSEFVQLCQNLVHETFPATIP
ncbi:hypothetical protein NPIL_34301 [Nephila pilipes]|uniref:Uncharacterized protein n=2 Tax=Nephila pilipes TaxID=299642 RepID=A0A8X6Q5X7_NEPPI|nr:hypothetical protein NPIL_34301 [Nephila pilipes]